MDSIINLQKKIVPELTDLLVQRYQILRQVSHEYPIGRRALSARLGLSERVLRAQVDFLKNCGLLNFSSSGMTVTDEGAVILRELSDYVRKLQDISSLEKTLSDALKIGTVVIIPGDSEQEEVVKREIGRASARILSKVLGDGNEHIVAVSGGNRLIKNNHLVCQAIQQLNEQGFHCQLKIFGEHDDKNEDLSKYPFATYMNQLNKNEFYEWLDRIPLFILVSELETFGLVVADAINCHCSILLSNNIGASSILQLKEEDIIINPHNITTLANKIRHLLENPNADRLLKSINTEAYSERQAWINLKSICEKL